MSTNIPILISYSKIDCDSVARGGKACTHTDPPTYWRSSRFLKYMCLCALFAISEFITLLSRSLLCAPFAATSLSFVAVENVLCLATQTRVDSKPKVSKEGYPPCSILTSLSLCEIGDCEPESFESPPPPKGERDSCERVSLPLLFSICTRAEAGIAGIAFSMPSRRRT